MMQLIHGRAIQMALNDLAPNRIAVAYVGADWSQYINTEKLQEIVLSPTLGSNPFAIQAIVDKLGWDNVHFLDNLHTKLYLGERAAALGSFNLTRNGLSAQGLEEAGCLIQDLDHLTQLRALFDGYKLNASAAYPTTQDKEAQLTALRLLWSKAVREGVVDDASPTPSLPAFLPFANDVYIVWMVNEAAEYNEEVVNTSIIQGSMNFLQDDPIEPGKWLLCWAAREDGYPNRACNPYWLYIDEIYPAGAQNTIYPQLAVQRNDKQRLPEPFTLSKSVVAALRDVLASEHFPEFRWSEDPWHLAPTLPRRSELLLAVSQLALRHEFHARILTAMTEAVSRKLIESRILSRLEEQHAVEIAKDLLPRGPLPGFEKLMAANAAHLTFESILLEAPLRSLFSSAEHQAAQFSLDNPGRFGTGFK